MHSNAYEGNFSEIENDANSINNRRFFIRLYMGQTDEAR